MRMRWCLNGVTLLAGVLLGATGCSPADLVGEGELPPGTSDPKETQNHDGALRAYRSGLIAFRGAVGGLSYPVTFLGGILTDELGFVDPGTSGQPSDLLVDRRVLAEYTDLSSEERLFPSYSSYNVTYQVLHKARASARVGEWLLRNFAPTESPALQAHLLAAEGYADIYLADLYCSGIPLSTVDPEGYTLVPGSSTTEVYRRAVALFDSALARAADSSRIVHFASLGKARALVALGQYALAAQAVAGVPDGFDYQLQYDTTSTIFPDGSYTAGTATNFMVLLAYSGYSYFGVGMPDQEGQNGGDWLSSGDPRTDALAYQSNAGPVYLPSKYDAFGGSPITIADWREARLIEAEAALQAGDPATFLNILNALRQSATFPPAPGDTTGTPRTLPPLADPGSFDARVDLLFRERGFWFFLTGHRQGDLRRLVREYGRDPSTVYPIGRHLLTGASYGSDVNVPVPAAERRYNRLYTGCIDRRA